MNLNEKLLNIQSELKATKSQYNKFGSFYYRSCEDILEAVKPLLMKYKVTMTITDEMVSVGNRIYVKATVRVYDFENKEQIENSAFAREEESKKGMDGSQVTGASSSYARKYALNGMFLIDDNKDSDTTNGLEPPKEEKEKVATPEQIKEILDLTPDEKTRKAMLGYYGVAKFEDMTDAQAKHAIARRKESTKEVK